MARYTCTDYRLEMILLSLIRRLNDATLESQERKRLQQEIREIERTMGLEEVDS